MTLQKVEPTEALLKLAVTAKAAFATDEDELCVYCGHAENHTLVIGFDEVTALPRIDALRCEDCNGAFCWKRKEVELESLELPENPSN